MHFYQKHNHVSWKSTIKGNNNVINILYLKYLVDCVEKQK